MALHLTHGSQTTMSDDHRHMCALMAHLPRHSHAWGPSAPAWAAGPRAAGRGRDRRASQRPQQHVPHTALSRRRSSTASPRWGARRSGSLPAWRWHSRGQKDQPPLRGRGAADLGTGPQEDEPSDTELGDVYILNECPNLVHRKAPQAVPAGLQNTTGGKRDPGLHKLVPVPKETWEKPWPEVHIQTPTRSFVPGEASCSATLPPPRHLIPCEKET